MTEADLRYITRLIESGEVIGPILELGAGYGGSTCREIFTNAGIQYFATDIIASKEVDYVADFSSAESVNQAFHNNKFGCALVLNVLEHTFDPISVLDNVLRLVKEGGTLVVITPAIWTLHNYPIDCYRLLPNWYEQYATTRNISLVNDWFEYVKYGRVRYHSDKNGNYQFPLPTDKKFKYWKSRIVQKIFNTYGRGMSFPSHVAIGVLFKK